MRYMGACRLYSSPTMISLKIKVFSAPQLFQGDWIRLPASNMIPRMVEVGATAPPSHGVYDANRFEVKPVPVDADGRSMKYCSACGEYVSRAGFHRDESRRDKLAYICKECRNGRERSRYHARRVA